MISPLLRCCIFPSQNPYPWCSSLWRCSHIALWEFLNYLKMHNFCVSFHLFSKHAFPFNIWVSSTFWAFLLILGNLPPCHIAAACLPCVWIPRQIKWHGLFLFSPPPPSSSILHSSSPFSPPSLSSPPSSSRKLPRFTGGLKKTSYIKLSLIVHLSLFLNYFVNETKNPTRRPQFPLCHHLLLDSLVRIIRQEKEI